MYESQTTAPMFTPIHIEGEGSFGVVIKALDAEGNQVAVKKVKKAERYISREMEVLQLISKIPQCIRLLNVFHSYDSQKRLMQNFVFEYMPTSLEKYLCQHAKAHKFIKNSQLRTIMEQIFMGLKSIHELGICHRDLKPDNILMNDALTIKICDFGSAKIIGKKEEGGNITRIVARCYRPPEIVLTHPDYSYPVDMWTTGCILLELMTLQTTFEARSDGLLFFEHCQLIGTPTLKEKEFLFKYTKDDIKLSLEKYIEQSKCDRVQIKNILPDFYSIEERKLAGDMIEKLLCWSPYDRLTAEKCLEHGFIKAFSNC